MLLWCQLLWRTRKHISTRRECSECPSYGEVESREHDVKCKDADEEKKIMLISQKRKYVKKNKIKNFKTVGEIGKCLKN